LEGVNVQLEDRIEVGIEVGGITWYRVTHLGYGYCAANVKSGLEMYQGVWRPSGHPAPGGVPAAQYR
jgi:hypothetical protein